MTETKNEKKGFKLGLASGASGPGWDSLDKLTDDELKHEYNDRIPVLAQMGGYMYQSILCEELNRLQVEVRRRGIPVHPETKVAG